MVPTPPSDSSNSEDQAPGSGDGGAPLPGKARPFDFRAELSRRRHTTDGAASSAPAPPGPLAPLPQSLPPGQAPRRMEEDGRMSPDEDPAIDVRAPANAPEGPDLPDLPPALRRDPEPASSSATGVGADTDGGALCCPDLETEAVLGLLDTLVARSAALPAGIAQAVGDYLERLRVEVVAIAHETALKLAAERSPRVLGQRLQRLAEALVPERMHGGLAAPRPPLEDELPRELGASLARLPAIVQKLRDSALAVLSTRLGLEVMEPQVGRTIDPVRHSVVESEHGQDPSADNSVLREEAPGWLLGGEVLAPADVIRYTCPHAAGPGLPDLDDLGPRRLDEDAQGRKREK